ncbi:MAG: serpin family protein, partial [Propionibacteriaceae bacterium]|nr:serpin family protein [Propionibacteriaceae bacterium]
LLPYDSLPESLDADNPPETPVVHQASRILAIDAEIKQPYLERISRFYDAKAESTTSADAKANLDAWAKLHTAGLIPKSAIDPTPDTVAVLQDALLFGAAWRQPFTDEAPMDFDTPRGIETVDGVSEAMLVPWVEGDRWQAVRLAYDDNLAADVILPADGVAPESLTVDELEAARTALDDEAPSSVLVTMPTLDLTAKNDLLETLPQLDLSNLSGIVPGAEASQWVQQAKLIVSARGTVGAALTEMGLTFSGGGPIAEVEFIVDRPYVFRVLDTSTGWPLFLATISDPTRE